MSRDGIEDIYPLSPMQQGMLFHELQSPGAGFYFNQLSCELQGALDLVAFERAWQEVLDRHPALRTAFDWEDGEEPLQVVCRGVRLPIQRLDWRDLPAGEQRRRFDAFLEQDRRRGFQLAEAPLARLTLIQTAGESFRFVLSHHHLLLDGWSLPIVLREAFALYQGHQAGRPMPLPPPPPFRDFIAWLQRRGLDGAEAFWRARLADVDSPTPLGIDRPGATGERREEREAVLSPDSTARLLAFARRQQVTISTLVHGAWALLLSRHAGRREVLFGTTVSGRPPDLPGAGSMVGLTINTIPLRVQVPGDAPVEDWLRELQHLQLEAQAHEHAPLARIQRWSGVPPPAPLFESLVVFENYPLDASLGEGVQGLRVHDVRTHERGHHPLVLVAGARRELVLRIFHDAHRIGGDAAQRALDHLREILERFAAVRPGGRLREIDLLAPGERRQIIARSAGPTAARPDACAHHLFAAQAARAPDAVALEMDGARLTYGELHRRARRLAHHLRSLGAGPETIVGLCADRSFELIAGMLGVLEAGAAYLPLDPSYPPERLGLMVGEAAPPLVLAQERLAALLPPDVPKVLLDTEWDASPRQPPGPLPDTSLDALAYVIYTSGSTGRPKGALLTHRGLCDIALTAIDALELGPGSRVLQAAALGFDTSVWEIFSTLLAGGTLCLAPREALVPGPDLRTLLARRGITTLTATPSLLAHTPADGLPALRTVVSGGEVCTPELAARWRPGRRLLNAYGPTEVTVCATLDTDVDPACPTLGRPLPNEQVYVLDPRLEPAPTGVPGELFIGGAGVARGYLKRPALTAERFIPDPFSGRPGARLYRTGDVGRYLPDGRIEFLGRLDAQIKLRGYRIEPGEIEAVLSTHPGVREVAVVLREDAPGQQRLVAYVAGATRVTEDDLPDRLRAFARQKLPPHMVPAAIVALDVLPRAPSGKLDRRALPAPGATTGAEHDAPRTAAEQALAGIFGQVLGVPQVGVHDSFFQLGGDSILSLQVVSRAAQAGLRFTPRELFEHPTVAGLAAAAGSAPAVPAEQWPASRTVRRLDEHGHSILAPSDFPLAELDQAELDRAVALLEVALLEKDAPALRDDLEDLYPLSPMQQGMLFHDAGSPGSGVYFNQLACELEGPLDPGAFERAWQQAVDRHTALRTAFVWEGLRAPLQAVLRRVRPPLVRLDWRDVPPAEQPERFERLLDADRRRGFDLAVPPLLRLALVRTAEAKHLFLLSHHHLLLDGWSLPILLREVFDAYEAFGEGRPPPSGTPLPYRDHIAWLRRQDMAGAEAFWRRELAGFRAPTQLGLERTRWAGDEEGRGARSRALTEEATAALSALARRRGLTLNTWVQGAWALLLARYGGEDDVLFGATVSGRPPDLPAVESRIGLFINTLPVRVRAAPGAVLLPWLEELQARQVELRQHGHAPLARIHRWSEVPPAIPLFESLVVFENYPVDEALRHGLSTLAVRDVRPVGENSLPLMLLAIPGRALELRIVHDRQRFDGDAVERMLGHLVTLLARMVDGPERRLSELSLLGEEEEAALLRAGGPLHGPAHPGEPVHRRFEAQVERSPEAAAVTFEGRSLSYRELDARANQLAHRLRREGVGPDVPVALAMDRSLEMVVAILGVLKAGGTYVPLDPAYPSERLAFMLEDARAPVLVTQPELSGRLPRGEAQLVLLDSTWAVLAGEPDERPHIPVDPAHLAYVIYTSGSTGRPKGTQITHGNVSRLFDTTRAWFDFGPDDVWTLFHSYAFDFSVWELWGALLHGGRLVVVPHWVSRSPEAFHGLLASEKVTVLNQTPSAFRQLAAEDERHAPGALALRLVIFGGEALELASLRPWMARHGDRRPRLVNMYGITETTVHVTYRPLRRGDVEDGAGSVIGRALPDLELHVLDPQYRPAPAGVPGELYVGGPGLARGYLGRPELTAERFIPHPFSSVTGARLYRTGDRARRLADGDVEYLGRLDHQVKIRGFRIELGEIEARLARHPAVRESAVVVREDAPGEKRLVAYASPRAGASLDHAEVRAWLARELPDHFLPSALVVLDALPLTVQGKIDRRALPAPSGARPRLSRREVAPRTPREEMLASLWREVLRVDQVGVHDDFFELGGDSILGLQIASRATQAGHPLTPRQIFQHPTIAALAEVVVAQAATSAGQGPLPGPGGSFTPSAFPLARLEQEPLERLMASIAGEVEDLYPLTPMQHGMLLHSLSAPGSAVYVSQLSCTIEGPLDAGAFERAWREAMERHAALRTSFHWQGLDRPLQAVLRRAPVPLVLEDWRGVDAAEQARRFQAALERERERGFTPSQAPLVRLALLRTGERSHRFVLTHHHLLWDGWSLPILLADVFAAYEDAPPRPPPPRFSEHVAWLERQEPGAAEEFWRRSLHGFTVPTPLQLEERRQPRQGEGPRRAFEELLLPEEVTARLLGFARRHRLTPNTLIQGAWALLLSRYGGGDDVVFGVTVAGRPATLPGAESMVGLFINTLPLRVQLPGDLPVTAWLKEIQERQGRMSQHEHSPLALVQRWSQVPAGTPLFESIVVFENYPADAAIAQVLKSLTVRDVAGAEESHYPFVLVAAPGRELVLRLLHDPRRVDGETVRRALEHLRVLLEQLASAPERRLGEVKLAHEATRARATPPAPLRRAFVPPRTPVEELIAAIWAEILELDRVGAEDSFFELGGHSLLATRAISRLRQAFELEIPVRSFFEAPTVAGMARAVLEARAKGPVTEPAPLRVERPERVPLSFAQQRLWFLEQLEPGSSAYHVPIALRAEGELRLDVLERALGEVVRRHEALRTGFAAEDGTPVQRIAPAVEVPVRRIDARHLAKEAREEFLRQISAEENGRPFDLARPPLLRLAVVELGDRDRALFLTMHHIVSDGWSIEVLLRELGALYQAFARGAPSPLPELPAQYADHAIWQRGEAHAAVLDRQLVYWRERLAGAPRVLELPADRPRPRVQTYRGERSSRELTAERSEALRALGRSEDATSFMTFLAAFGVLLGRLAGTTDLLVAAPAANRSRAEWEPLIGFFINTLILRVELSGEVTFRQLLARVRETCVGAYAHAELPFERLVEALQPERDLSRTPLVQVMLNLFSLDPERLQLPGLSWTAAAETQPGAKLDLTLYVAERDGRFHLDLVYNADLFERERMAELLGQLDHLLAQIVREPGERVDRLSLVTPGAASVLPDPDRPLPGGDGAGEPLLARIAHRIAEGPDRLAVVDGRGAWTYRRLGEESGRLAAQLREQGIQPQEVVAIHACRDASLVAALLGVLESGAAFALLDPADAPVRLARRLRAVAPKALIELEAAGPLSPALEEAGREQALRCRIRLPGDDRPAPSPGHPERAGLAYVSFTSGSTGEPKAIAATLQPLEHFLDWHCSTFELRSSDRFSLLSGLGHDPLLRDVFAPLWLGATLCIPDPDILLGGRLSDWMARERITVAHLTPATSRLMDGPMPSLRHAFFGGDVLDRADVARLRALAPQVTCVNFYGATETPQAVGYHVVRGDAPRGRVPLGRGIEGAQLLVLDAMGRLAGVGEPGEIHVRTRHLSLGYLNDAALTERRFLPGSHGAGMYRTGDLGRYLPGGEVEIAGRADRQLKLRGHRVEPGEIEAALLEHPSVSAAAAIAREDGAGEPRLVGYVVPRGGAALSTDALRDHLQERLPGYLVPSAYVLLDELPLTPSRKLDRHALPAPPAPAEPGEAATAPGSPAEELLAGLFAEVLQVPRVGRHQHFFELGGHSLLATQVVARLRRTLGVELPLRAIFEAPTVAALARRVDSLQRAIAAPPLVALPRGDRLPLSFAQERLWFLDRLQPGLTAYNMALSVQLEGDLDAAALEGALQALAQRHEPLRARFESIDGQPFQQIAAAAAVPFVAEDLRPLTEPERSAVASRRMAEEAGRPFDLARGPLVRAALWRIADEVHLLLVGLHHIVADGWSLGVLVRDLAELYSARRAGRAPGLAPLPIQYLDFAAWQRGWLQGAVLEQQLSHWRRHLAGAPPELRLPVDRPRPAAPTHRGERLGFSLPAKLVADLEALGRDRGCTLFMTVLAALQALLHRYSDEDRVVVGTPIAGRSQLDTEGLIGLFANTLALCGDLSGEPSFRELLTRTRDRVLGAFAHQDLPFEKLVEELQPARALGRSPLFQVMLVLQNAPPPRIDLPGLRLSPGPIERRTARFDLTVELVPSAGGLDGSLEYAADLFDAPTARGILGHFLNLLRAAASTPDRPIHQLSLLDPDERADLLRAAQPARIALPPPAPLHVRFEAQVDRRPEEIAVTFDGRSLTYAELDARSNQLAHRLRKLGVGPEVKVALALERSVEAVVGILGVLKAGGAYVPLDPVHPRDRLAFTFEDAGARVLVAHPEPAGRMALPGSQVVLLTPSGESLAGEPSDRLRAQVEPDQLAYVIYTSGSTGKPKGVEVTHAAVSRLFDSTAAWFDFGPGDVWTLFHSYAFDFSVWELWGALLHGGRLVVVPHWVSRSPGELRALLVSEKVTVLNQTPSAFRQLAAADEARPPGELALRLIIFGGEALEPASLRPWVDRHGDLRPRLVNMYGITETTVHVTYRPLSRADLDAAGAGSAIGRPIPDLTLHVLDRRQRPVPVGVPGELCVGGSGLARGYLGRPALTAGRFVPDPFSSEPGARLYRSGDLARRRPDGDIEYLGRIDRQVKIRGFRVELGEIESALAEHPAIREAAVALHGGDGEARLVAYVVGRAGPAPAGPELRQFLQGRLPEYMVPAAWVALAGLPLTENGKVDRGALPPPGAWTGTSGAPLRSRLELELSRMFEDVLGVTGVGPEDDFFALGGHSLLAVRLVARIQGRYGRELPLASLFQRPTVAGLARLLRQSAVEPDRSPVVPIQPRGGRPPLFLLPPLGGHVLGYVELVRLLGLEQPCYGLEEPVLPGAPVAETPQAMATPLVEAMRGVQPRGPYHLCGWSFGGVVAFEMAQQLRRLGEPVALLALLDAEVPDPRKEVLDDAGLIAGLLAGLAGGRLTAEELRGLEPGERLRRAFESARRAGLPDEIDLPRFSALYDLARTRYRSLDGYAPAPYPERIVLFRATGEQRDREATLGWGAIGARVDVHEVPGSHRDLLQRPHVEHLAAKLRQCLEGAE